MGVDEETLECMPPEIEDVPKVENEQGPRPFKIWTAIEFQNYNPPDGVDILGKAILRHTQLTLLCGQGGIGKSTWTLALAVAQICGESSFCGLPLDPKPRKWLFIGTENGADRWKADLAIVCNQLDEAGRAAVAERLLVAAIFDDEAPDLELPDAAGRIQATIREAQADVVVLDPWAELVANEIDSAVVKAAILSLRRAVRCGSPNASTLLVVHARTGREAVADAGGNFGGMNAQRGNRALTNNARCVLSIVPRYEDGTDLVLACAKINDGEKFAPRALRVDRGRLRYAIDPSFNVDEWREEVRGKGTGRKCEVADVVEVVRSGVRKTGEIVDALKTKVERRTVMDRLDAAVSCGALQKVAHGQYVLGPKADLYQ